MAVPLKKGYKFRVEHVTKPASNYMSSFDIYEKYYGIGYLVKGDRQVSTPERAFFVHDGYLSPICMGVYHKSSPLSDRNYEVYAVRFVSSVTTRIKEIIGEHEFNDLMLHTALSVPDEIKPKIIAIYEAFPRRNRLFIQNLRQQIQKQNRTDNARRIAKKYPGNIQRAWILQFQLFLHPF